MHNLGNVFRFELTRTLKKPTFWVSTLAMPLLLVVIFGLVFISNKAGSDQVESMSKMSVEKIAVVDETGYITPAFAKANKITLVKADDKSTEIDKVKNGQLDMLAVYPANPATDKTQIYAADDGLFGNAKYQTAASSILKTAVSDSVGNKKTVTILTAPTFDSSVTTFKDGVKAAGIEQYIAPLIFLVILYIVIILLSNQMLTSTTEEKENRVTEIILTTMKPGALILGKILALLLLGLLQIIVVALPAVLAFFIFKSDVTSMISGIDWSQVLAFDLTKMLLGLAYLIGGLLLYTGILVGIGAAVPTAKDANSYFGVAIMAMFAPLYTIMLILTDPNQLIVQIFSYFPLSAPVTMMIRNAFDALPLWSAILGLVIVYGSAIFVLWLAARIFRYGTLEYSRRLSLKEIFSKKARA